MAESNTDWQTSQNLPLAFRGSSKWKEALRVAIISLNMTKTDGDAGSKIGLSRSFVIAPSEAGFTIVLHSAFLFISQKRKLRRC